MALVTDTGHGIRIYGFSSGTQSFLVGNTPTAWIMEGTDAQQVREGLSGVGKLNGFTPSGGVTATSSPQAYANGSGVRIDGTPAPDRHDNEEHLNLGARFAHPEYVELTYEQAAGLRDALDDYYARR